MILTSIASLISGSSKQCILFQKIYQFSRLLFHSVPSCCCKKIFNFKNLIACFGNLKEHTIDISLFYWKSPRKVRKLAKKMAINIPFFYSEIELTIWLLFYHFVPYDVHFSIFHQNWSHKKIWKILHFALQLLLFIMSCLMVFD